MRYIDHPDHDLNPLAFKPEAGRMRLYGKSSPPPPPDYAAAAKETAAGNLEAARTATTANRPNQYTPYGQIEWSQDPTNPDKWSSRETLAPEAQRALDSQLALNTKFGEVANIGFDRARSIFENPELDMSGLPQRGINVGQTAQEAIMSRLQPQLAQQDEALRTRMANQGIGLGSEAYGREMGLQGQRANDLQMQAALQGINLDQANRSAAMQEQAYLQDRPLNLINALRSGNQVQAPQFQQFANQATTSGPDMLGATSANYDAQVQAVNAKNAQSSGLMSGLMGVGMGIMGLPVAGAAPGMAGGSLGGNALKGMFSDRRLKTNIKPVGKLDNGLTVYSYDYVWGGPTQIGVMAQEVEFVIPEAVFEVDGYKAVDYARL